MINFSQIQVFIAIVESGGFIAAGEKMHRSQPAITNAIKKLESSLGFELFDRKVYRPQLTAKGKAFYQKAREVAAQFMQLENSAETLRSGVETQFSIDLDIALPLSGYAPLIQSFIRQYPETCFSLSNNTFVRCLERLERRECHLCIAASHIRSPQIEYLRMPSIRMIPVASRDYYDQHKERINNPKLGIYCMQIMIAGTQQELYQLKIEPLSNSMPKWFVGDMYIRKQLILSGMGIGRLPDHLVEKELAEGSLVQLNTRDYVAVTMDIYAMRLNNQEHGIVSNYAWQSLKSYADDTVSPELK
ncbi:TPA: LysR family transcriptional regulator [Legionella pneumophila]|uniref:LysR family transcriptional regulator n=1 Tax=Legionella pneumophila TaxID=446 RepID=A0AAP3HF32_LEGPN|nr:LysR family transcriptional regulator [Legionella pneumophila]HAT8848378.1 LysR family transcriptional regulator [Legionella pneumophila subsp. pneumophila]MCO1452525.1 LysR family transcriptional regulator [Legionella pneumophila]MCZ4682094.1 LysR family transcriptional regulator [Legionella pneumophila]MCZ4691369.1 LysR family transcriptional regulator [Legionella pneumophila]MCZ4711039.1 LysR family transcriptional regulator [Legionella pneumophila]